MEFTVASRTDVGRVRTNNEDNFLVDEELGLFVVADGMGGHSAGEVASKTACEVLQKELSGLTKQREKYKQSGKNSDLKALGKGVEAAMVAACKAIYKTAAKNPELAGMGCTCTLMFLVGNNKGILGHVGDSRLFLLRGGAIHQLSEDHTFVNELLRRGAITKAQAKNHPQGNVLSRAMGPQPNVAVDTMIFDIDPGDVYLLCSDGLYNYFPEPDEMVPSLGSVDQVGALNQLIDAALERGGHDNVTGITVRFAGGQQNVAIAAQQRIAILKRIPIFAHLTYNELVKVVGLTLMRHKNGGEDIVVEGEMGDELFVVLAGEVDVLKGNDVLVTLQAGAHLGEMAMIDNAPRSATVRAKQPTSLLVMRREEFFGLIRSEPVIATKLLWSFVQVMSTRLRETNEALKGARAAAAVDDSEFEIFIDDEN